jgi:hypothetical protein
MENIKLLPDKDGHPYYAIEGCCDTIKWVDTIDELCQECPLRKIIPDGINQQIIFKAKQRMKITSAESFKQYVEREIQDADDAMSKARNEYLRYTHETNEWRELKESLLPYKLLVIPEIVAKHETTFDLSGIKFLYLWNLERIKALVNIKLEPDQKPKGLKTKYTKEQRESLFDELSGAKFIKGRKEDFIAATTPDHLPLDFEKITFLIQGKGKKSNIGHKTAFQDLIYSLTDDSNVRKFNQSTSSLFQDISGKPIIMDNIGKHSTPFRLKMKPIFRKYPTE